MTTTSPQVAPIFVILPDAQEVRGRLHARRQVKDGWLYQVGILVWQNGTNGLGEPAEQRVWVSPAHARPVPGVSYEHVPTHRLSPTDTPPQSRPPAWTLQYLPHRPGHPGATLLHVIGCTPSDRTLTREEALAASVNPAQQPALSATPPDPSPRNSGRPTRTVRPNKSATTSPNRTRIPAKRFYSRPARTSDTTRNGERAPASSGRSSPAMVPDRPCSRVQTRLSVTGPGADPAEDADRIAARAQSLRRGPRQKRRTHPARPVGRVRGCVVSAAGRYGSGVLRGPRRWRSG